MYEFRYVCVPQTPPIVFYLLWRIIKFKCQLYVCALPSLLARERGYVSNVQMSSTSHYGQNYLLYVGLRIRHPY